MPPSYQPKDLRFRERVTESFGRQRAMQTLGITITRLAPGEIELAMPYAPAFTQQHGFVHAGIVTTALDSACGYAAFSLMPADSEVLTVEFKTNLLAPAKGERFVFRARASAFAIDAGTEKLIATMTGTLMALWTGPRGK